MLKRYSKSQHGDKEGLMHIYDDKMKRRPRRASILMMGDISVRLIGVDGADGDST